MDAVKRVCKECGAVEGDGSEGCVETLPPKHAWVVPADALKPWLDPVEVAALARPIEHPVAPSLEDRIVKALAAAGVDGLDEEALIEGLCNVDPRAEGGTHRILADLEERGVTRIKVDVEGCEVFTLSPAEWARRLSDATVMLCQQVGGTDRAALATTFERLLAGTEA